MSGFQLNTEERLLTLNNITIQIEHDSSIFYPVQKASFDINCNEIVALVGESGSGKTMTALAIVDLLPKHAKLIQGQIIFKETILTRSVINQFRGKHIAMIFQNAQTALNPVFRVGSQISDVMTTHLNISAVVARQRILGLFEKVNLPDPENVFRCYPHQLSGGMAQRVMIAMALSCQAKLIIADEPTSALDVTTQHQILSLLEVLKSQYHFSMLLISHDLDVVSRLADRIFIINEGRISESEKAQKNMELVTVNNLVGNNVIL
jgi:peptide/nickel transport system ATP-binding protein